MRTSTQNEPLTDAELDRLGDFLKGCKGGRAMNVEALNGLFAALIAKGLGHEEQTGIQGLCHRGLVMRLKNGAFSAEFSVEEMMRSA
jgi:hypothetical protein